MNCASKKGKVINKKKHADSHKSYVNTHACIHISSSMQKYTSSRVKEQVARQELKHDAGQRPHVRRSVVVGPQNHLMIGTQDKYSCVNREAQRERARV